MRLLTVVALTLLVACRGTEPDPGPLRLSISLDRAAVAMDDSVRISLTLTNISRLPVLVMPADAYGMCMKAFEVADTFGRVVYPASAFCALALIYVPPPEPLAPGHQIAITDWWVPGTSWMEAEAGPPGPGMYLVRGRVAGDDNLVHSRRKQVLVTP